MSCLLRPIAVLFVLLCLPITAQAREVKVAVAANFTEPARALAAAYEARTGHRAVMSFGPSGQFYTQITQGAPYEVFLSADAERPIKAELDGYGVKGTRFVYAYGALVLWSAKPGLIDPQGKVLSKSAFDKLAIADPATAPYGVAAVEAMKRMKLFDALSAKIVKGSSIAQTYTFIASGSAELGFVALSQVSRSKKGSRWIVPKNYYAPIDQQAILLRAGETNPAARAYLDFLKTPQAVSIIRSFGYEAR